MPTCGHIAEIRSKVVWVGDDGHRVDQLPALDWFRSGKRIRRCVLVETALSKPPGILKLGVGPGPNLLKPDHQFGVVLYSREQAVLISVLHRARPGDGVAELVVDRGRVATPGMDLA